MVYGESYKGKFRLLSTSGIVEMTNRVSVRTKA